MVWDSLWKRATRDKPAHILCFDCLSARLGRAVSWCDLNAAPVNEVILLNGTHEPAVQAEINKYMNPGA